MKNCYPPGPAHHDRAHEGLPDGIINALQMMKDHHEPYPIIVLDRTYNVVDLNRGAQTMLGALASGVDPGWSTHARCVGVRAGVDLKWCFVQGISLRKSS